LRRRVRLAADQASCKSVRELHDRILDDPALAARVLEALTVQVSEMFRDPEFYKVLRERIAPVLATYPSLKIWIAGCSTGEELYSFAILLHEEGLLERSILYATDVHAESLRRAESGVYDVTRVRAFSENYVRAGGKASLSDYYRTGSDRAIFDR